MALTSLTSLNSLTSTFAKVELFITLLLFHHQLVLRHTLHIRLDDGFHLALHSLAHLWLFVGYVVFEQKVGTETIQGFGLAAIPLQEIVALDILIEAIIIVYRPCIFGRSGEKVDTEAHILLVVAKIAQYRRHYVYLLSYSIAHTRFKFATWVEEDDRRAETT